MSNKFFEGLRRAIQVLGEKPYELYWKELGKFIHAFSDAEHRLLNLLQNYAGVTDAIAGVLFSGTRMDAAKDYLNSILDATNQTDIKTRLERPLAQLAAIATIRNHLVHWIARDDGEDDLLVSNAYLAPSAARLKEFRINPEQMGFMITDLRRINVLLMIADLPPKNRGDLDKYLASPWLYKPPQPSPRANTHRSSRNPQEPKPRPPSSREKRDEGMKKRKT